MINNKFLIFSTVEKFNAKKSQISNDSIVFVKETNKQFLYTHGTYFYTSATDASELETRLSAVETLAGGNEDAIEIINGDENTSGSILAAKKAVLDLIGTVEAGETVVSMIGDAASAASAAQDDIDDHKADTNNPHSVTAAQVGLGNLTNDAQVKRTEMGVANGVATLDANGLVPSSQLPSYVDDVIEVANYAALPATGEAGKIYVTLDDNKTYRWGGSAYAEISASIALGETTGTAYEGSKGKANADAIAALQTGKVDKESGKSLVSDTEITKLSGLKTQTEITSDIATAKSEAIAAAVGTNADTAGTKTVEGAYKQIAADKADLEDDIALKANTADVVWQAGTGTNTAVVKGANTTANNTGEVAVGVYNTSTTGASGTLFSVGNGTGSAATSNAFEVRKDGSVYIIKDGSAANLITLLSNEIDWYEE